MSETEYVFKGELSPLETKRLVKRLRRISFFVSMEIFMPTEADRGYPYYTNMKVTVSQLEKLLNDMHRFHENKKARGDAVPMLKVRQTEHCLFIG